MELRLRQPLVRLRSLVGPAALAALLGGASPALARIHLPGEPGAPPDETGASAEPPDESVLALSARAGYTGAVLPAGGVAVAWRHAPFELGVAASYGEEQLAGELGGQVASDPQLASFSVQSLTLAGTLVTAEGRYFLPDDFTVTVGLGWRRLAGHVALAANDGSALTADATVTNVVATAAVGNLWSWENGFFVGVDWVGVALPLSSSVAVATQGTGAAASDLQSQATALAGTLAHAPALILLVGQIGWRF